MWQRMVWGHFAIYVRWLLSWRYISSLHSSDEAQEGETAVYCCDPALSVIAVLVNQVSVSQSVSQSIKFIVHWCLEMFTPLIIGK